jgi:Tfp pilus assembly protein FimT
MIESPGKKYAHRSAESGMSLVEVMIVALIATILITIAIPNINSAIRAYKLRNTADHMAERLSAVRALAMAKNRSVTFAFNNATGRYGFDFTNDGAPDTTDPDESTIIYDFESLPSDITANFPGNAPIIVIFNSRGELPIGATEQFITLNNYNRSLRVRVNLRGKISVE